MEIKDGRHVFDKLTHPVTSLITIPRQNNIYQNFCLEGTFTTMCNSTYLPIWNFNVTPQLPAMGPNSGSAVTLKTGRREVPGSNQGRSCRPSRSEFSVVFSEIA